MGVLDQPQPVAQPLQGGAGDEDAALHRVGHLAVQPVGHRGQQAVARAHRLASGVLDQEAAGAVGALHHARRKAGLADQRRLLVAGHAQHRQRRAQPVGVGLAEVRRAVQHLGQQAGGDIEQLEQMFIPLLGVDVEQQRARRVAGIGAVRAAAGQAPEQEAVHRAEAQLAARGACTGARHVVEDPAQLGRGKIRIDQQPGARRHLRFMAGGLQRGAVVGGAPVLPDDRRIDGLAAGGVPHQGGLALVGDADGADVRRPQPAVGQRLAAHGERAVPQVLGGMLDPAIAGEMLGEFLLRAGHRAAAGREDDRPAAGGALVDGEKVVAHGGSVIHGQWARTSPGSAPPAPRRSAPPPARAARR